MLEYILECFRVVVFSYVVTNILMVSGQIMSKYSDFLGDINRSDKWYSWIAKPLGYCDNCFAGQVSLWYGLYLFGFNIITIITFICTNLILLKQLHKHFNNA